MRYSLLTWLLFILALTNSAKGYCSQYTPADTLPGHTHFVRRLSVALCTQLTAEAQNTAFDKLTPQAAQDLLQRQFLVAMRSDSVALIALMTEAEKRNITPQAVGQQLGKDAMFLVAQNCAPARPLVIRLSQTEMGQRALAAQRPAMSAAEVKALQPITTALCTQLAAANAKKPFASLTPAQRQKTFMTALHVAFKPQTSQLLHYYGSAQLDKMLRSGELDGKIASLMTTHGKCAQYLLLIGADRLEERQKP